MICKQCGKENPDVANFCRYCRARMQPQAIPNNPTPNGYRPPQGNPVYNNPMAGRPMESPPTMNRPMATPQPLGNKSTSKGGIVPFLFAILGGIPGIVLWVVLGLVGYEWPLVAALIGFGVYFGYTKAGGDFAKKGAIVAWCIIVALEVYLGAHLVWSVVFYEAFQKRSNPISVEASIFRLYDLIALSDNGTSTFVFDVLKSLAFAVIGCIVMFRRLIKKQK